MTAEALFGVNLDATAPATRDGAVMALRDFMGKHRAGPILALYGSCNHAGRYADAANRLAAWQAEMEGLAGLLGGWHGPARGCNTGFIEPRDGTTIEYRPDYGSGTCLIQYRRGAGNSPDQGSCTRSTPTPVCSTRRLRSEIEKGPGIAAGAPLAE